MNRKRFLKTGAVAAGIAASGALLGTIGAPNELQALASEASGALAEEGVLHPNAAEDPFFDDFRSLPAGT